MLEIIFIGLCWIFTKVTETIMLIWFIVNQDAPWYVTIFFVIAIIVGSIFDLMLLVKVTNSTMK